ncbi:hypothetical protein [Herbaspirillum sp. RV1423]|uniref:hypothetical protein n=1 Tax=Herbaspirillum sp. RV1423 TaxID=1443993 RepID=UPI0004B15B22|nr:hypothetical protein [Herbaspirillum sp. RV1423]
MKSALHCVSPAIALLQELETILRDPLLGPHAAMQVAAAIDKVVQAHRHGNAGIVDKDAYISLWACMPDDRTNQQALISLASI